MSNGTSASDDLAFDKYVKDGAYHWRELDKRWSNGIYSPPLEARYDAILRCIPTDARSILDVGCGDGRLLWAAAQVCPGAALTAVDTDPTGVALARARVQQAGAQATIHLSGVHQLPFEANAFDVVLMADVVEHILDPALAVAEIFRVLKPKGVLVLSTPHRQPDFVWDPLYHVHEFDHAELRTLLSGVFEEVQISACWPMVWVRLWRRHVLFRVLLRVLGRLGFKPLNGSSPQASVEYGQIIAVSHKLKAS